jgi:transcriptional regulator with XRE-family HTH domain
MVDVADAERKAFSERLRKILDDLGVPVRGRTVWLQKRWQRCTGEKLSIPTFRKWLEAQALPHTSRIRPLAEMLGVDYQYLMTGEADASANSEDRLRDQAGHYSAGLITQMVEHQPIDAKMLAGCIEDLEAVLSKSGEHSSPIEKAGLICAMYLQRSLKDKDMPADAVAALAMAIGHDVHQ